MQRPERGRHGKVGGGTKSFSYHTHPISAPLPQTLISSPMSTPSRLAPPVSSLPHMSCPSLAPLLPVMSCPLLCPLPHTPVPPYPPSPKTHSIHLSLPKFALCLIYPCSLPSPVYCPHHDCFLSFLVLYLLLHPPPTPLFYPTEIREGTYRGSQWNGGSGKGEAGREVSRQGNGKAEEEGSIRRRRAA